MMSSGSKISDRETIRRSQLDSFEGGVDPGLSLRRSSKFMNEQRFLKNPENREPRVHARIRILWNNLCLAPKPHELPLFRVRDILAVKQDPPSGRFHEADGGAAERGLAGSTLTDNRDGFALRNGEGHTVDGLDEHARFEDRRS